ncbi:GIY-YIG nuclease family protein [Mycobacterium sp. ITM-2016-00318]|uniref:GIY-YIG nuclease family protein n=1 Tax=Mycobacterium sp. ITM-2016-00318 TaxID=2099693 RepID=UPI0011581C94|nr:GIY-YIG nuclease family protein [Mycobacterium sp. ITM-2016-00318]WNG95007.1 GIY-YIG nuclease family protein [Mycobacterium sp. ITM-2016-00318]
MATIPLRSLIGDLDPAKCKLHCAVFNGEEYPLDVLARSSDEWMQWSRWRPVRDEFNRQFIFSLAQDRDRGTHWLFGGVFEVLKRRPKPLSYSYDLKLRDDLMGPFIKRLMVSFRPPGRQMRMNLDTHLDHIAVLSIREHTYAGETFPGHDRINHTFGTLEVAIKQDWHDWRGALQGMKGVYVIHDQETGKGYVGSATGDTGIWARLSEYVAKLHGGNKGLVELVGQKGPEYAKANLRFALLDYGPMRTPDEKVLERESYWKDVLLTRKFGNNKN